MFSKSFELDMPWVLAEEIKACESDGIAGPVELNIEFPPEFEAIAFLANAAAPLGSAVIDLCVASKASETSYAGKPE